MSEQKLPEMRDETSPRRSTCCGALELLEKQSGSPVYRPVRANMQSGQLSCNDWALRLTPITSGGRVSRKGHGAVLINYCPFCGAKLAREDGR